MELLEHIADALEAARQVALEFRPGREQVEHKDDGDPVTAADRAIDQVLRERLPRPGEGWLSEETTDTPARLDCRTLWVVDPLDGTREFIEGIPEWCISVAWVVDGQPRAGGIVNPMTDELILGAVDTGVFVNGKQARVSDLPPTDGNVLASRSERRRGEWDRFENADFRVTTTGSVALKLARVSAGRAEATWTLTPKHEWDVAAGVALVTAAGGSVVTTEGRPPIFNRPTPLFPGLIAWPGSGGHPDWQNVVNGLVDDPATLQSDHAIRRQALPPAE